MTHIKGLFTARLVVYWPGIDNNIDNIILSCKQCQDHLPAHHSEPIVIKPRSDRPFQEIAADFCAYGGQEFLILVDCYSDYGLKSFPWDATPLHPDS